MIVYDCDGLMAEVIEREAVVLTLSGGGSMEMTVSEFMDVAMAVMTAKDEDGDDV